MKHQTHLHRDGDLLIVHKLSNFRNAFTSIDELTNQIHSGLCGIGQFEIFVYEEAPEGHIERCIYTSGVVSVPARQTETAA